MTDLAGPPAPDPRWPASDMLEAAWGLIANASGGDWAKASPEWQAAAARWRDAYVAGAAVPVPPAGPWHIAKTKIGEPLGPTWQVGKFRAAHGPGAQSAILESICELASEAEATAVRDALNGVSPGAPPAARRDPTDAMIDAAFRSFHGYLNAPGARGLTENRQRASIAEALRAALAEDK